MRVRQSHRNVEISPVVVTAPSRVRVQRSVQSCAGCHHGEVRLRAGRWREEALSRQAVGHPPQSHAGGRTAQGGFLKKKKKEMKKIYIYGVKLYGCMG